MATEKEIDALTKEIEVARSRRHEGIDTLTGKELRELEAEIQNKQRQRADMIADGCGPCLKCKGAPLGRVQQVAVSGDVVLGYGIICARPQCRARARHVALEKVRAQWNSRPQGMNEADASGAQLNTQH